MLSRMSSGALILLSLLLVVNGEVLELSQGKIRGTTLNSRNGRDYLAFFGIPYAKPPVGELRLKDPEPLNKWEGEIDGTQVPAPCAQNSMQKKNWNTGQEDCLKLNIFTPKIKPERLLPVLLFIHGGAFRVGSPPGKYGAGYFLDNDIVVITVQYRLGILGFLSTEDEKIPGNFGLKDQSMAINWVKENVKNFGGDPERITIYGESAGGASVHYQALSKLNGDIIKMAISGSGVINKFWALSEKGDAIKNAQEVFKLTGCDDLECLQKKPAVELQNVEYNFTYWDVEPITIFKPIVESERKGAFLTVNPLKEKVEIPWLTGFSSDEGLLKVAFLEANETAKNEFYANTELYIKKMLVSEDSKELDDSVKTIMEKYFKGTNEEKLNGLKEFYANINFVGPIFQILKNQKQKYIYEFNYNSEHSLYKLFSGGKRSPGAMHADIMTLLFNCSDLLPNSKLTPEDEKVSQRVVKLWVDLATSWEKTFKENWKGEDDEYLEINEKNELKKGYNKQNLDFWMNLPIFKSKFA